MGDINHYHLDIEYSYDKTNACINVWLTRRAAQDVIYALMQQMFEADCQEFQVTLSGTLTEDEIDRK